MKFECIFILLFGLLFFRCEAQVGENTSLFVQDSLKLISSQFKFTEGASVDKKGNVFFTDQPNDQLWKYGVDGKLSLFLSKTGRSNGTYFDKNGNLITCADEDNELWSITEKGKVKLIYKNPIGQNLNGPNDLWIDTKGGIYFTDPYYQRNYWTRQQPDIKGENVYYFPKGKKDIITVDSSLVRPNGIVGTPDGKTLYVADALGAKIYQYNIESDATLSNRKVFIAKRSDGMTLDEKGNVYLTGKSGVDIFSAGGQHIGNIKIPEPHTANLCFGGRNRDILFITASKSVYVLKMKVKGVE
ncbi:MAG: SMP-30/gluconolactonase/LRE family protein [Chitinophagaceae bacterium]|nr:MAG: SMP-30/gluconolactonase/LRE family protein [Chitinophagaceae bacterium]